MSGITAPERPVLGVGSTRNFSASYVGKLDAGESLTGTPTVTEEDTSDLTITNKAVSTASLTICHDTVAAGRAVQFTVKGHLAAGTVRGDDSEATGRYTIKITCDTDAGQKAVPGYVEFTVEP